MNILTAHQVKEKMAQNPETKLIMVLGTNAYNKAHIPGSLDMSDIETVKMTFSKNVEIIVHCSDVACPASYKAYGLLEQAGYKNIYRLAGGLNEWEESGFDLITDNTND